MAITNEHRYLGRVKRAPGPLDRGYRFATVEPIAELGAEFAAWTSPIPDAVTRFPNRGFVHWHDAPAQLHVGSLWEFSVEDLGDMRRDDRPEHCQLTHAIEPIEVLDLRGWNDQMALRSALTSEGIHLPFSPIARRTVLWLEGGVCVGPLVVKRATDGVRWTLEGPDAHRDPTRMPAWHVTEEDFRRARIEGDRYFVLSLDRSAGIQNWASDAQVSRSILRRLRKMGPHVVTALGVTESVFDSYLELVASADFMREDAAIERARADRLAGLRRSLIADRDLIREAAQVLQQSESVQEQLVHEVAEAKAQLLSAARGELDAELTPLRDQLATLDGQIARRKEQLSTLEEQLRSSERAVEQKVASFEREVESRLSDIAGRPEAAFAEQSILRALLGPSRPTARRNYRRPEWQSGGTLESEAGLRQSIGTAAVRMGASVHSFLSVHAALVSQLIPVVFGLRAFEILSHYARAAAAGRLHWIPVGGSILEPQDLFGQFDPSSGRIIPHSAGLLDVIQDAVETRRLHLVVLDGFNRAPVEAYLMPMLQMAAAARCGDTSRSLRLAPAALLSDDDPYRGVANVSWPPNVLLCCIPAHGTASLPLCDDVWRFLSLVDTDDAERHAVAIPHIPEPEASDRLDTATELSPELWSVLCEQATPDERGNISTVLQRVAVELGLSSIDAHAAAAFARALIQNGLSEPEALGMAATSVLVARSVAGEHVCEQSLRAAGLGASVGWRRVGDEATRLRE